MDRLKKITERKRLWVQLITAVLMNGYLAGFLEGKIYTGPLKAACVPGLNCYSCPGALGSCPIGALQSVLSSRNYQFSYYVTGFLFAVGAFFGRLVCGWLCPFGLVQDLLYKIPLKRKMKNLPGHRILRWFKYVILLVFVILLPMFFVDMTGQGLPWFCKYICPAGTLEAGIPLVLTNGMLRAAVGFLYQWKIAILLLIIVGSIVVYRPFCKYLCPLGAIYSLFNPIAFWRYEVDREKCVGCNACSKVCKMGVDPKKTPNSPECIRCGDCLHVCGQKALKRVGFR